MSVMPPSPPSAPPAAPPGSSSNDDPGEKTAVIQGDQETINKELAKAKEQQACLIVIRGSPQGHRFFLTQEDMIAGRDPAAEISLPDQSISRKHIRLTKEGEKVRLFDQGTTNGTYVNDKRLNKGESVILAKEDMIRIGNTILKFLPAGELEIIFYGNLGSAAHHDPMTKVYNKGYLMEALEAEFKRAKALHTDLCLLFFDLDHFKKVNDTYGHDAGDFVLIEFANLIRTSFLRPKDIFARYGGEEFIILLSRTSGQQATEIAERIRAGIEAHAFVYEGKRIPITTSLGVSELRADIESSQTMLKMADKALYAAKTSGRNRVCVG